MIGFVYLWINKVNGKKYVGAHVGSEEDGYVGSGVLFKKAILKYGIESFERKILYKEYESVENLFRKEFEIINELNAVFSTEYYNLTNYDPKYTECSCGGRKRIVTDETREKIRIARTGSKASESTKKKMSKKRKGKPSPTKGIIGLTSGDKNGNWGKSWFNNGIENRLFVSGEQPEGWVSGVMRESNAGEKNSFFGKNHTEETKARLRELNLDKCGEKNPFFGKKHTVETREKMKLYWSKRRQLNENSK